MKGKPWTPSELQVLRERYATDYPAAIARDLGRSVGMVYQQAAKLGLHAKRYVPRRTKREYQTVRKLHAKGKTDTQIASATGIDRRTVNYMRIKLGLPVIVDPTAKRRGVENQLKTLGLDSPTQLRTRAFRLYAIENGWPEDLRPREVQILNVLATAGVPLTNVEIAERIGMRTDRRNSGHGGPVLLSGNGPGGTYTATLARRGLVTMLPRAGPKTQKDKNGKGSGRRLSLYTLGPVALAILQERASKTKEN